MLLVVVGQRVPVRTFRVAKLGVVLLLQGNPVAATEQLLIKLPLAGSHWRRMPQRIGLDENVRIVFLADAEKSVGSLLDIDAEITLHSEVDDGRCHHLVVVVHLLNVA